ncbi:MAG: class I SAM-dependent methyltransferase [Chloroflexi bacterium]|nr:MAG: class I SAM-dependent methyltransferase [Chloroflexota bacterium]
MTFNSAAEKYTYVNQMFARIAHRYDLMNRVMTVGQDRRWRRLLVRQANLPPGGRLLDIATGTGDIAFEALRQHPDLAQVVGADFTLPMMLVGRQRQQEQPHTAGRLSWSAADTLHLPFPDATFDAVASGFLMRNVVSVPQALAEQRRVCKPGGRVLVLEIPRPADTLFGRLFRFYFHQIVPRLGGLISGQPDAYAYLPASAEAFLRPEELQTVMEQVGLKEVRYTMLMFGTVALHVGVR